MHSRQYPHEPYFYKDESSDKPTLSQSQKRDSVRVQVTPVYMCDPYKPGVFKKIRLPSDVNEDIEDENAVHDYPDHPDEHLSVSKLSKMASDADHVSPPMRELTKRERSSSLKANSLNQEDSKPVSELMVRQHSNKSAKARPKSKPKEEK